MKVMVLAISTATKTILEVTGLSTEAQLVQRKIDGAMYGAMDLDSLNRIPFIHTSGAMI